MCGLGSEAVCLFLCTKCAAYFPYKNGTGDTRPRQARRGLAAISFHACVNVNTTDATTVCFQHVLHVNWLLKYSAASSETLSFH